MSTSHSPSAYDGKTVLVTGAAGYIGSALVQRLARHPCRIIMASRRADVAAKAPATGLAKIESLTGDVTDPDFWPAALKRSDADLVFHFAGQNSVYAAARDPSADFAANVAPVLNLAEAARDMPKTIDVLYSGTATVVGMEPSDDHRDRPLTVYDQHKWMAEQYLELYARLGSLRAVTLRLANVYGPGVTVGSPDRGILNKVIRAALDGGPVSIYGDGAYVRDYIYIDDVIEAFVAAGAHMDRVNANHYVLGTGTGTLVRDAFTKAATLAAAASSKEPDISHVPWPEDLSMIERRNFVADIGELTADTGWQPQIGLRQGITRTIAAFLAEKTT